MRKGMQKRASAQARTTTKDSLPIQFGGNEQKPISWGNLDMALRRPEWVCFRLEQVYREAIQEICIHGKMSEAEFIAVSESQRPDLPPEAAVHVGVLQYLRKQLGGWLPVDAIAATPVVTPTASDMMVEKPVALRVLVVDDTAMTREIAGAFLTVGGHEVTYAEGGADAVKAVATTDFDVVLMDVCMTEVDGLEATRRIRRLSGKHGLVPILALTARTFADQVKECVEAGMNDHVCKPFSPETLLTAVSRAASAGPKSNENLPFAPWQVYGECTTAISSFDLEPLSLDKTVFDRTAFFLTPDLVSAHLRNIAERGETLLHSLREPGALKRDGDDLCEAARSISGSAGMFGFNHVTSQGRRLEKAIQSGTVDDGTVTGDFTDSLEAMLQVIYERKSVSVDA